jgi:ABC-2 family transporter
MRTVLVLVGNEFRRFAADKAAISLTFIVPLVLIYIFGNVFGVNSEERGPKGIPLAVVNETDAPAPAAIISALQKEPAFKVITSHKDANGVERVLIEAEVREMMRADDIRFALIFPADATSDSEVALKMKFLRNARNEIETRRWMAYCRRRSSPLRRRRCSHRCSGWARIRLAARPWRVSTTR